MSSQATPVKPADMTEKEKAIFDQQSKLWKEARDLKVASMAHLALLSSGAIIVSVNALVPILKLGGAPVYVQWLIAAWVILLLATVLTVPYRYTLGQWAGILGRYLDHYSGGLGEEDRKRLKRKMDRCVCCLRVLSVVTWICFVVGMVSLLRFVAANLLK